MKKSLMLILTALTVGVTALGAQEPVEGLAFSGSVITGLRYRSFGGTAGYNVFDIEASDDYLSEGDTATLRAALNRGFYGASFALTLNANNTQANLWTVDRIYAGEVSLWAKLLNDKLRIKAGYDYDYDYFTPVSAWCLTPDWPGSNALQLTVYPIEGLQIDVRAKNSPANNAFGSWQTPAWYKGEEYARNIDVGVKYVNPNFTVFAAFDDNWTAGTPGDQQADPPVDAVDDSTQADIFGYFAFTGIPKLALSMESKFQDLTAEKKDIDGDKIGVTNITALQAGYQITDAFYARVFFIAGGPGKPGSFFNTKPLLGEEGFSFAVDAEFSYRLNDALTLSLRPIFQIPDTEYADHFDLFVKPKVAWTLASFPYAATINFWYMLGYYSDESETWKASGNGKDNLFHTLAVTFNWSF
ncbi:MAG: hypothetical protein LBK83_16655 [Treponema sp.]|jgi:hypothetical protein|nr:hypothetical protein [Treponema sp.]